MNVSELVQKSDTEWWIEPGGSMRAVVEAAERAGLSRAVARLEPMICVKG